MGKVIAIITGATGGIGKEFVRQIASEKKVDEVWALADARKGKDMSICSAYAGFIHIYSKIMPQKHVMNQWMKGIKDYI